MCGRAVDTYISMPFPGPTVKSKQVGKQVGFQVGPKCGNSDLITHQFLELLNKKVIYTDVLK